MNKTNNSHCVVMNLIVATLVALSLIAAASAQTGGRVAADNSVRDRNTFTDPRDGKIYRTVEIDGLTWMAQNLNFARPAKGNSWCYNNNASNCEKYGRLYDLDAAKNACPAEWRLPSMDDWISLKTAAAGAKEKLNMDEWILQVAAAATDAQEKLKSKTGWNMSYCELDGYVRGNYNGTDDLGFSALPGGTRGHQSEDATRFEFLNARGYWWTSTEFEYEMYEMFGLDYKRHAMLYVTLGHGDRASYGDDTDGNGSTGFSVRCVRGKAVEGTDKFIDTFKKIREMMWEEGKEYFKKASEMAKAAEAPRVIADFESAFLATVAKGKNPAQITESDLIFNSPESQWWQYVVTRGGKITATSKVSFGNVEAGAATLTSVYNANRRCFNRTITPEELAPMIPNWRSDCR